MHRIAVIFFAFLAMYASSSLAAQSQLARIGNRDTQLTIRLGRSGPQVTQLLSGSNVGWIGTDATTLIDHVVVADKTQMLNWHFDRTASHVQDDAVDAMYESDAPKLRLTWTWRARATHGPLEHTIRIENLSGRVITLPLQDSFRFRWHIAASRALQQLWIDKGAGEAPPVGTHLVDVTDGYRWLGTSSTYAHPR
jgi:hypothetical protein